MNGKLSLIDRAFFMVETDASPKHVAGFLTLSLPADKDYHYLISMVERLKGHDKAQAPFNRTVTSLLKIPLFYKTVSELDMDYHVQIHEVADIDDTMAVNQLITDLHKERLDTKKPLWQFHLIYCKTSQRFGLYKKIHHIYGDGITILSWVVGSCRPEASGELVPFWSVKRKIKQQKSSFSLMSPIRLLVSLFVYFKDILFLLFNNIFRFVKPNRTDNAIPFSGHRTVLTGKVTSGRAMATVKLPLDELLQACKLTRTTVNDFMLTAIDIATHRFLKDYGCDEFERPLIVQMPVSLRRPGDSSAGNKISIALVKMAHGRQDPYKRLRQVVNSNFLVKQEVKVYSPTAYTHISLMYQMCSLVIDILKLSDFARPLGNLMVSNVPGPQIPLFFGECALESIYPISTIPPGGGLNVTLVSYNGEVNVGMLCCDSKIESLEPLTEYLVDAFELLIESIHDPGVSIADLGEKSRNEKLTIVEDSVGVQH